MQVNLYAAVLTCAIQEVLQLSFHFSGGFKEILSVSEAHLFSDVPTVFLVSVYKGKKSFISEMLSQ